MMDFFSGCGLICLVFDLLAGHGLERIKIESADDFFVREELLKEFFANKEAQEELVGNFVDVVHGLCLF